MVKDYNKNNNRTLSSVLVLYLKEKIERKLFLETYQFTNWDST